MDLKQENDYLETKLAALRIEYGVCAKANLSLERQLKHLTQTIDVLNERIGKLRTELEGRPPHCLEENLHSLYNSLWDAINHIDNTLNRGQ